MAEIIKKIADSTKRDQLDSLREDQILEDWVHKRKLDQIEVFTTKQGKYPATSRLTEIIVLIKEVPLKSYRIDCIAYWRKSGWKLIEVKQERELGPSVIGDLLVKSEIFENEYMVNPDRIERIILADHIPDEFAEIAESIESKYELGIELRELA